MAQAVGEGEPNASMAPCIHRLEGPVYIVDAYV
jgi:hypothetical protein